MKKIWLILALLAVACGLAGCEDDTKEKARELHFINSSHYVVYVIPLTIEWGGFALPPGGDVKFKDIRDVDYRYEPKNKVQEGTASTDRYIVFVDSPPEEKTE